MWKRLQIYERLVTAFFLLNIAFYILNKDFFNYIVPKDIEGYMFWISLGLYLGFQLCKYEYKRVWNNMQEREQKEDKSTKMPIGHSPKLPAVQIITALVV